MSNENSITNNTQIVSDSNPKSEENKPAPTLSRSELVETAIRFLQNPRVVPTPLESKRLFLAKKGLTEAEIEEALKKSGAYNVPENTNTLVQQQQQQQYLQPPQLPPKELSYQNMIVASNNQSLFHRIVKWISNIVFAGCLAYTAYKLIIKKFFSNKKSKTEVNMEKILNDNNRLQETIKEMRDSLETLKQSVENINGVVKQLGVSKQTSQSPDIEIKNEVQSIKSLLLNRSQFPAPPTFQPIAVLPKWQTDSKILNKEPSNTSLSDSIIENKLEISNELTNSNIVIGDDLNKSINNDTVVIDNLKLENIN